MATTEEASAVSKVAEKSIEHSALSQTENTQRSLIGKAVRIKGNVAATENMLIDGQVVGGIVVKNSKLEIGDTAQVDANVYAKIIIVKGRVKGDVNASDQVVVAHSGQVEGNINAPAISMEDGAFFKGNINMEKQEISWEDSIPDIHDENHEKSSSFGFLFRRTRGTHADHPTATPHIENVAPKISEEAKPVAAPIDKKVYPESIIAGKSYIGKTVLIKGQIEAEEDMVISGEIVGNVYFKVNSLEIGREAHVNGNIFVKDLIALGEIKGDICADHVSIKKPAHVIGVIHSPRVSIESGAAFQGKVEMEQQNIEEAYTKSIAPAATKEKASVHSKPVLEANFDDLKSGLQGVITPTTKSKRVPWPE